MDWLEALPQGWIRTRLKRVVQPHRPITYGIVQAGPHVPDGVPYVRPIDMQDEGGVVDPERLYRTDDGIATAYRRSALQPGDLVCSIGPSFGKVMVVDRQLAGANLTQGTARVAICSRYDSRYYFWVLRSPLVRSQWEATVGGATFRALNLGPLAETSVPLPPVQIQRRIAAFLDHETSRIDELIREQEQLSELLAEKRTERIRELVTSGCRQGVQMRATGIDWIGEVPMHWQLERAKWSVALLKGGVWGSEPDGGMWDVPCVRVADFDRENGEVGQAVPTHRKVLPSERVDRTLTHGDLIIEKSGGGDSQPVGFVVKYIGESAAVCSNFTSRCKLASCHDASYWRYLHSVLYSSRLNVRSIKQTSGIQNLDVHGYLDEVVPYPPLTEQREIARELDSLTETLFELSSHAREAIKLLQERREALISAAVTGQIDVRDWRPGDGVGAVA